VENKIKCLDHGFVKLLNISGAVPREYEYEEINTDGTEEGVDIVQEFSARDIDPAICARISFDNFEEVRTEEQDLHLVEYLVANHHNTPIEMTEIWLEMKLPIFVARQFVRHRTACLNEVSGRYVTLPEEYYIPEVVGGKSTSGAKQGQEDNLSKEVQDSFKSSLEMCCAMSYSNYLSAISSGIAPEHARMFLHLNHYTHWVWKQDLHNLMYFLSLRLHSHAQIEARVYAQAIYDLLKQHLPETMKLFDKYRRM
jgi:thymidylate synthase (FAD)